MEHILKHYKELLQDIYSQPEDDGHKAWAIDAIKWANGYLKDVATVLDIGCGTGFLQDTFLELGMVYSGITASEKDRRAAHKLKRNVSIGEMHTLYENYDLVVARHVLEHSPFPILALMEWRDAANKYLLLIAPAPEHWGWAGKNHYSMANKQMLWWWLKRAGWKIVAETEFKTSDYLYKLHYSDNMERATRGKELIEAPGPPKVLEYRMVCEKAELQKE